MTFAAQVEILREHRDGAFKLKRLDVTRKVYAHVKPEFIHRNIGNMPDDFTRLIAEKARLMTWQGHPRSEVAYRYAAWQRAAKEARARRASEAQPPSPERTLRSTRASTRRTL